jgi:hypothetical protein
MRRRGRSGWILVLVLVLGAFLGGLIGEMLEQYVPVLALKSPAYGLTKPWVLNLDMLNLTFGFSIQVSVGSAIGVIVALLLYRTL